MHVQLRISRSWFLPVQEVHLWDLRPRMADLARLTDLLSTLLTDGFAHLCNAPPFHPIRNRQVHGIPSSVLLHIPEKGVLIDPASDRQAGIRPGTIPGNGVHTP